MMTSDVLQMLQQRLRGKHPGHNTLITELVDFVSFGQRQVQASCLTVAFFLRTKLAQLDGRWLNRTDKEVPVCPLTD